MQKNEALFYNYSDEDFTWKLDGVEYTFKAGSTTPMTKGEFYHFSKHLVDRELLKLQKRTNDEVLRAEHLRKCTGLLDDSGPNIPSVQFESGTVEKARFCQHCVSKGGRHMRDCTRPADKPIPKSEEKPFADAQ